MKPARFLSLLPLTGILLAQAPPRIEPFVSENKLFALYKPAAWQVREEPRPDSFRITVSAPDAASRVDFFWARNQQRSANALWFVNAFRGLLAMTYPDVTFTQVLVSRDSTRAMAAVEFTTGATRVRGRYYFESKPAGLSAQGYWASERGLAVQRPLLLNIMASLAFTKAPPPSASFRPQFVQLALQNRQAPDGSLSLRTPPDWGFVAARGRVITSAPDGSMGFVFTSFEGNPMVRGANIAQGVLATPYVPPPQTLGAILRAFGHRASQVRSAQPAHASNQ